MDYWEEAVHGAFDEAGIVATEEQIKSVTESIKISHDNYSLWTGRK